MVFFLVFIGLLLLVLGGKWLMKSSVALSLNLNISRIVIGMTVVSFATSSPELIVSIQAAISGYSNIAIGNAIGSNIANIGFVLAIVLLITPIFIQDSFRQTDWPMMIFSSLIFALMISYDNRLSRLEGCFLFLLLVFFLYYLLKKKYTKNYDTKSFERMTNFKIVVYLFLASFCLWLGSELLIDGAVKLVSILGVSDRIISITVVAFGTSVPELATSVMALIKNEKAYEETINQIIKILKNYKFDKIAAIESRGFVFASAVSYILKKPFVMLRKKNKLPADVHSIDFELEYGTATIEVHKDSIDENDNVLIIDDLIATGGTAEAAARLVEISKGKVAAFIFVINLFDLNGTDKLVKKGYKVENLIDFPGH